MKNNSFTIYIITLFSFCIFFNDIFAQNGNITIHKDARLDQRISNYGEITPPHTTPQINGYRIQLAFEQSKSEIEKHRTTFSNSFPKIDTYVIYSAPNFFLKVGDFRTKIEAEKVKSQVESDFPTSNVIRDQINLPKIDE